MRRFFGIALISLAAIIALGQLITIPNTISTMAQAIRYNNIGAWAHFLGVIIGNITMIAVIFFLIWLGVKQLKKKKI